MSTDPQNIGYYYAVVGSNSIPIYGANPTAATAVVNSTTQINLNHHYRFNSNNNNNNTVNELNESGPIFNSSNYYIQPPYSKNSLNQLNIGSNQGLCQQEDADGQLVRSRGDSINFLPIASGNLEDKNFYPHIQDQIVSSNFQNDFNSYNAPHSVSNLHSIGNNPSNYLDEYQRNSNPNRNTPFNNFIPTHHTNLAGSSTLLGCSTNDMQYYSSYGGYGMQSYHHPHQQHYSHQYSMIQNYLNPSQYSSQPMSSQSYLMNEIQNFPSSINNNNNINPHHYIYQNVSTSLQNLCFDNDINSQIIGGVQSLQQQQQSLDDNKQGMNGYIQDYQKQFDSPQPKNKQNIDYTPIKQENTYELKDKSKNKQNGFNCDSNEKNHLKTTDKIKRKYQSHHHSENKKDDQHDHSQQDENTPTEQALLAKRSSSHCQNKKKKSHTLSEATTNFDQNSDIICTPTLKERSYKKVKIEEKDKDNQIQSSSSTTSTEQPISSNKNASSDHAITNSNSNNINSSYTSNTQHSSNKQGLSNLPREKQIDALKLIMKSLPPAYLPFLHKKISDYQRLDYLKKHHYVQYQSDLNKIKSLLPSNFIDTFDVSIESVYSNTFIMNGILKSMPDESLKKIGSLTIKERREKIHKYKIKRDKRVNCRKISYDVRKRVADSRLRVKGRFVTKEQALQMIGDFSGDIDKYTNQQLRELLFLKFGSEHGTSTNPNNTSCITNCNNNSSKKRNSDGFTDDEDHSDLDEDQNDDDNILNLISVNDQNNRINQDYFDDDQDNDNINYKKNISSNKNKKSIV